MKKLLLLFIAAIGTQVHAQNINPEVDHVPGKSAPSNSCCNDAQCSGWSIDVNATGGFLMQNLSFVNQAANYTNSINNRISTPEFEEGMSRGLDVEAAYFFGHKREFGIGFGLMYMRQQGRISMDNFHTEYQSLDYFGNTFRQVLNGNGKVNESIRTSNLSIPLLFKYQKWVTHKVGFTADAGLLINVLERSHYESKSSFDYEAIYKYTGTQGNIVPVYDNAPTPAQGDLLIMKNQYLYMSSSSAITSYFNTLRSNGYNVGLGVTPGNTRGNVSFNRPSVGILLRPAVSIALCRYASLNLGVYYLYQHFNNDAQSGYRITDKVGSYNSMLNGVRKSDNHSLGFSVGVRFNICKPKACEAPVAAEPAGDPEPDDEGPVASPSPADDDDEETKVNISTPILFEHDKTVIRPSSYPVLEEAVRELRENERATLEIHGYTDNTGKKEYNKALSVKRANAVKRYLSNKGIKGKLMKIIGHGSNEPAASNGTSEGRAKNRRAVMKLKQ